jgi:membrane fusion protein, copper/silver efflux system
MTTHDAFNRWGRRLGLVAGGALFLAVLLFVQHTRHGWPFSLHHGMSATGPATKHPETHATAKPGAEAHGRAHVDFDPAKLETLGIRVEVAQLGAVANPIRAVATVVPDESRVSHVHTRVAGWIEKLYVNTTGQKVKAGEPLAGIFSQELYASQVELLAAIGAAREGPSSVVGSSARTRLKVLGMSEAEIQALEKRGTPNRLVTVVAPRSGVVLRRAVAVGTAIDPSTELMTVADLSQVWVLAEVSEEESSGIREGTPAMLDFTASGKAPFEAKVEFVYPTLTERTRTLRVRFSLQNEDRSLRPGLYGTAEFRVEPRKTLTVSRDAVVDTGTEQHVFVVTAPGHLEPRPIRLGARMADKVEIREGIKEGEKVVASGVFLIDSESRLRASGGGTGHAGHGGAAAGGSGGHEGHGGSTAPDIHQGHGG